MRPRDRFCLALLCVFVSVTSQAAEQRPNIILIMADDLGIEGLGSYGGLSYQTPHLDKLAQNGLRFTQAYAQPLCSNTRIQLMTGKYNNRNWLFFGILDPRERTFGHALKNEGYDTCMAGKWQLYSYDPPDYPGASQRRGTGMLVEHTGFDRHCTWHVGHTEDKGSRYADPRLSVDGKIIDYKGQFGPDLFVNYINDYLEEKQHSEKPFFIYYPMALPHWPMVPTPFSDDWSDESKRFAEDTKYFKDMVQYMDHCVGQVVRKVDELGLGEQTLILFYSDNGTHLKITSETKDGPVQGGKGMTSDTGTHVPLIARWTGHLTAGVNDDLIDSTDFFPTLIEAAGAELPTATALDGISFWPILNGLPRPAPRRIIFSHYDPRPGWDKDHFTKVRFARTKRYKLYDDGKFYDLRNDLLEEKPLAVPDNSERRGLIRKRLQRVLDEMPNPETPPRD